MNQALQTELAMHLEQLCVHIGHRHVGSFANRQASTYVANRLHTHGFAVTQPEFTCMDWINRGCHLSVNGQSLTAYTSPYSPAIAFSGRFETAGNLRDLEGKSLVGKVVVLHDDLCKEQIMPKNFVFYNPEEHQRLIALLEARSPTAIVAITGHNPELAGGLYPFPLFEDGDLDIPSVYMTEEEGQVLHRLLDADLTLSIDSQRIPATGCNVLGRKGNMDKRFVVSAHLDTKQNTPGALDNGSGVAILLALAGRLEHYSGTLGLELAALNGEDYYAQPGQMLYLRQNPALNSQVTLAVNVDGAGLRGCRSSYTCFNCNDKTLQALRDSFQDGNRFLMIEPWHQGDHMLFAMNDIPTIAISSEQLYVVAAEIAHTENDTIANVDYDNLASIVEALEQLIHELEPTP